MVEFKVRLKHECEDQEGNYRITHKGKRLTISDSLFVFHANNFDEGMSTIKMTEVKEITVTENRNKKK